MSGAEKVIDAVRASRAFAPTARWIVACSGGLDSTVLLHALVTYAQIPRTKLSAIHIDHRLHPQSRTWAAACRERAHALGVDCEVRVAAHRPASGSGIEQWAREVRYAAFTELVAAGDVVVMAHHRNDLAETVLMRLMRGAGPKGLSGMPATRALGGGHLLRPLLRVLRADIEDYAVAHGLAWSDDPSNADAAFDRNYVRHHVLPGLQARWPGAVEQIAQAAELQAGAAAGLDAYADTLLSAATDPVHGGLRLDPITETHPGMLSWVLRRWLDREGLPLPDAVQLAEMQRMVCARADSNPLLAYKGAQVRRYRGCLYAGWAPVSIDIAPRDWHIAAPLHLAWGELRAVPAQGDGIALAALTGRAVSVRFRVGGERCRLPGRAHHHTLKHLFQQWGVPPWQRADTPLVYIGGELAAVGGYCVCEPFAATAGEESLRIVWRREPRDGLPSGTTS
jgi:tRNA(Ile)-lysidine synthase